MILKMAKMTRQSRDAKGRGQTDSIISSAEQHSETLYTGISKAANWEWTTCGGDDDDCFSVGILLDVERRFAAVKKERKKEKKTTFEKKWLWLLLLLQGFVMYISCPSTSSPSFLRHPPRAPSSTSSYCSLGRSLRSWPLYRVILTAAAATQPS